MRHYYILFYGIVSCAFLSCKEPVPDEGKNVRDAAFQGPRMFPWYGYDPKKKEPDTVFLDKFARLAGLPVILNGVEGIFARIWFWEGERRYIVSISKKGGSNTCQIVEWNSRKKDTTEFILIHRTWNVEPGSGWDNLWATMNSHRVLDLPGGKPYEEQEHKLTHMYTVQFEIAGPGRYRYYKYLEPEFYRYVDDNSRTMHEFLKYLSRELNFKVYDPSEKLFVEPDEKLRQEK